MSHLHTKSSTRSSRRGAVCIVTAALLASFGRGAPAQLAAFEWTFEVVKGGTGHVTNEVIHLESLDDNSGDGSRARFVAIAPVDGTVFADLDFVSLDAECDYELAVAYVGDIWQDDIGCTGVLPVAFEVREGETFGFGVVSVDSCCGPGILDVRNMVFDPATARDAGGGLDPRVVADLGLEGPMDADELSPAGDVDGDGVGDVFATTLDTTIFVPIRTPAVYSGRDGRMLRSWDRDFMGLTTSGFNQWNVDRLGDVDGDGHDDVLLGVNDYEHGEGAVRVASGRTGEELFACFGEAQFWNLGQDVSPAGDVDGDGTPDYLVGVPKPGFSGLGLDGQPAEVRLYSGADGELIWTHEDSVPKSRLGWSVTAVGDVDLDGVPDAAASTPAGRIVILSGATGQAVRTLAPAGPGPLDPRNNDATLTSAGDMDGDGLEDLLLGLRLEQGPAGEEFAGSVTLVSSADGTVLHRWEGTTTGEQLGRAVAGGHDIDGDGVPDIAFGSRELYPMGAGRVRVFSGRTLEVLAEWRGRRTDDCAAFPVLDAVTFPGDLDGDGLGDVAIGAHHLQVCGSGGFVRVFSRPDLPPPRLTATGSLEATSLVTLEVTDGLPSMPLFVVGGRERVDLPFRGGVLVPLPEAVLTAVTDADGGSVFQARWPSGLSPWWRSFVQCWQVDPSAPQGYVGTNAVVLTQPW